MRACWPLLLLLSSCGGQQAIPAGGLVSNNPCIDSVLEEIAAPGQVAAISIYSHDAASASVSANWARGLPAIGTSAEEAILAKPKLLLTGNLAFGGTNAALQKAGVKLRAFGVPATVAENQRQIQEIAAVIGREAAGADLIQRIDVATRPLPKSATPATAIIWQTSGFVPGQGTVQDELLSRAGFANASKIYGLQQWGQLPLETLISRPPDVIFMPVKAHGDAEGKSGREAAMRQKLLRHLPKTRIIDFPDRLLFCGGPTIIKAMDVMRGAKS